MVVRTLPVIFGALCTASQAGKVLLLPLSHPSHIGNFASMGEALQAEGHEVHLLTSMRHFAQVRKFNLIGQFQPSHGDDFHLIMESSIRDFFYGNFSMAMFSDVMSTNTRLCRHMVVNRTLMEHLHRQAFDLVIVDPIPLCRCVLAIAYALERPYIAYSPAFAPTWEAGVPALPTLEPHPMVALILHQLGLPGHAFGEAMPLPLRVLNSLVFMLARFKPEGEVDALLSEIGVDAPTAAELFQRIGMFLVNQETHCFDYPRISAPHYKFIGGTPTTMEPKPLPADVLDFVHGAPGLVIFSMGSEWDVGMSARFKSTLLAGFEKVSPLRVVMKFDSFLPDGLSVPANVMMMKWLPQSDLLGHNLTRVYIGHGGANGQMEALNYGVPMIMIPLSADQFHNSHRIVTRGYGLQLSVTTFTADELASAVRDVAARPSRYHDALTRCSRIVRSMPSPGSQFAFWVNHVLEFGTEHLQPPLRQLLLHSALMCDIVCLIVILLLLPCGLCRWCCRRALPDLPGTKQKEQ